MRHYSCAKQFAFYLFSLYLVPLPTHSHEIILELSPGFKSRKIQDHKGENDIQSVYRLVRDHVSLGINPSKIAVVFDVDGTLTNRSTPGNHPTQERYGSTQIVLELIDMGVRVAVSSAWNDFDETLGRLEDLGLAKALKIQDQDQIIKGEYQGMNYFHLGLVASIQDELVDSIYYRQKAFAPYIIYSPKEMETVEKVIFADDSSGNIKYFKEDVAGNYLYPKANQFDYFYLTAIGNNVPKVKQKYNVSHEGHETLNQTSCWAYFWSKLQFLYLRSK